MFLGTVEVERLSLGVTLPGQGASKVMGSVSGNSGGWQGGRGGVAPIDR